MSRLALRCHSLAKSWPWKRKAAPCATVAAAERQEHWSGDASMSLVDWLRCRAAIAANGRMINRGGMRQEVNGVRDHEAIRRLRCGRDKHPDPPRSDNERHTSNNDRHSSDSDRHRVIPVRYCLTCVRHCSILARHRPTRARHGGSRPRHQVHRARHSDHPTRHTESHSRHGVDGRGHTVTRSTITHDIHSARWLTRAAQRGIAAAH